MIAEETSEANLRWAGNTLTTNGVMRGRTLTVVATVDGGEGTAAGVVSRSSVDRRRARAAGARPPRRPPRDGRAGRGRAAAGRAALPASAGLGRRARRDLDRRSSRDFAPALGEAFAAARAGGRELFGFAEHELHTTYLGTSTGAAAAPRPADRHASSSTASPPTGPARPGSGTGHPGLHATSTSPRSTPSWPGGSAGPSAGSSCRPGRYETLLPPTAVADLMIYLYWSAGGPRRRTRAARSSAGRAAAPGSASSSPSCR